MIVFSNYGNSVDFDTLRTGFGYVSTGNYSLSYGLYIGAFRDSDVGIQIFIQPTYGIYTRSRGYSGWGAWNHISFES